MPRRHIPSRPRHVAPPDFTSPTALGIYGAWGMTLRDYFAAAALPAVIAHLEVALYDQAPEDRLFLGDGSPDLISAAEYSYAVADAMLAHRYRLPVEAYPQPAEFGSTENSGKAP